MENRLLISLAFDRSHLTRERRMLAEVGGNTNNPDNSLNRLYVQQEAGDGSQAGGRSEKYNQIYDQLNTRREMYDKETEGQKKMLEQVVKASIDTDGGAKTAYDQAKSLIAQLTPENVYSNQYNGPDGRPRSFENGRYAAMNSIEGRYLAIENKINDIQARVMARNGGNLPAGVIPFQQRLEAFRVNQTLNLSGTPPGQTSVDIRSYPRPFAVDSNVPENERSRAAFQLLRVPVNFRFPANFGGEAVTGLSGGAQYVKLPNERAATMGGQTFQVDVMDTTGTRKVGEVTANVTIYDQVSSRIRITYTNTTAVQEYFNKNSGGPNTGSDDFLLPGPDNAPEQGEAARKTFHETWQKMNSLTTEARDAYLAATRETSANRAPLLETYLKAMGDESTHLGGPAPTWPEGDPRATAHVSRRSEINTLTPSLNETLTNLREYTAFAETASRLSGETANALSAIPATVPGATEGAEAWEARIVLITTALTRLGTESDHLGDFAGNPAARGATEAQTGVVQARIKEVGDATTAQAKALEEARNGRNEAECGAFETKWKNLKDTSDKNLQGYEQVRDDEAPVDTRIAELGDYIEALKLESTHLETLNREVHQPGDPRLDTYDERSKTLAEDIPALTTALEQAEAYKTFEGIAKENRTATDAADALVAIIPPGESALAEWEQQVKALEDLGSALEGELSHLNTFIDSAAFDGSTPTERTAVTTRFEEVNKQIENNTKELAAAVESRNAAECNVFEITFDELRGDSTSAESYEDGDPEEMDPKIKGLGEYIDALKAESEHLDTLNREVHQPGDPRLDTYDERMKTSADLIPDMELKLEQFEAFQEFDGNATAYENETEGAYDAIPDTDPEASNLTEWENMKTKTEAYVTTLEAEEAHLETFAGSLAESGATETQATAVSDRLQAVKDSLKDMRDNELPRVNEARDEAERLVYDEKSTELNDDSEDAKDDYEKSIDNEDLPSQRLENLSDYITVLKTERAHLAEGKPDLYEDSDPRAQKYHDRADEIDALLPDLETTETNLDDLADFDAVNDENIDATDEAKNAIPDAPVGRGKVTEWKARQDAIQEHVDALTDENTHLEGLVDRPGSEAALPKELLSAFQQWMYANGELQDAGDQMTLATEGLNDAGRDKFEDDWKDLNVTSVADGGTHAATLASEAVPGAKILNLQTYRASLQRELTQLNGAAALPVKEGDTRPEQYSKRTGEVMTSIGDLNIVEAQLNSLSGFNEGSAKAQQATEKTDKTAAGAVTEMDPSPENLPTWTRRRNAVSANVDALKTEKTHLETFVASNPAYEAATPTQRTEATNRLTAVNTLLIERQTQLTAMQRGVDTASVDNITTIDTDARRPVRLNRNNNAERVINRYQQITLSKDSNTLMVLAGANTPVDNRAFPKIERNAGNNNVTITAGEAPAGTYQIMVGTGASAKRSTIVVTGAPRRRT